MSGLLATAAVSALLTAGFAAGYTLCGWWQRRRAADLGLGSVENKSGFAIRGELTGEPDAWGVRTNKALDAIDAHVRGATLAQAQQSAQGKSNIAADLAQCASSQQANTPPPNIPASASSRANAAQAMVDFVREYPVPMAHWSSCAVNNAPALEPGPCDCGGYDPATKALDEEERAIRLFHALRIGIIKPRKGVVEATWADLNEEQRDRYRAGVRAVLS